MNPFRRLFASLARLVRSPRSAPEPVRRSQMRSADLFRSFRPQRRAEFFVRAWTACPDIETVGGVFGMGPKRVAKVATQLRDLGVRLKALPYSDPASFARRRPSSPRPRPSSRRHHRRELFVRVWQTCTSVRQAAYILAMSPERVARFGLKLWSEGVNLKKLPMVEPTLN